MEGNGTRGTGGTTTLLDREEEEEDMDGMTTTAVVDIKIRGTATAVDMVDEAGIGAVAGMAEVDGDDVSASFTGW